MSLNWNFQRGGVFKPKTLRMESFWFVSLVWIFSGTIKTSPVLRYLNRIQLTYKGAIKILIFCRKNWHNIIEQYCCSIENKQSN